MPATTATATVHLFGIRHHGPGSARSLLDALVKLKPDCILIEGPPEGNGLLELAVRQDMQPPVAMLVYSPEDPASAVYYPFAVFSPEWQAIIYAISNSVPVRFIDLPQTHWMMLKKSKPSSERGRPRPQDTDDAENEAGTDPAEPRAWERGRPRPQDADDAENEAGTDPAEPRAWERGRPRPQDTDDADNESEDSTAGGADENCTADGEDILSVRRDPLSWLAKAAGHSDGERWWEHMVEQRRDSQDLFEAIREAMTTLREETEEENDEVDNLREAHMRQMIRAAQKENFNNIAVVCGAWHTTALSTMPPAKDDEALLKGLPRKKVEATWIPWTHGRLS
ncbi:MAG: DUF5682 family protein, partial [Terriglobales bacterium]